MTPHEARARRRPRGASEQDSQCAKRLTRSRRSWIGRGVNIRRSVRVLLGAVSLFATGALALAGDEPPALRAESLLQALPKDASTAALGARPAAEARRALERAKDATNAGDELQARRLGAVALEWAELATALVSATQAEAEATKAAEELQKAHEQVERARLLLEETQARKARAEQALQAAKAAEAAKQAGAGAPGSAAPAKSEPAKPAAAPPTESPKAETPKPKAPEASPKAAPSNEGGAK